MKLRYAEEFGMRPQDVGGSSVIWWHRWLAWQQAQTTRTAYSSREGYRDKTGTPNWAEWYSKYPDLAKRLRWAGEDEGDNG